MKQKPIDERIYKYVGKYHLNLSDIRKAIIKLPGNGVDQLTDYLNISESVKTPRAIICATLVHDINHAGEKIFQPRSYDYVTQMKPKQENANDVVKLRHRAHTKKAG